MKKFIIALLTLISLSYSANLFAQANNQNTNPPTAPQNTLTTKPLLKNNTSFNSPSEATPAPTALDPNYRLGVTSDGRP